MTLKNEGDIFKSERAMSRETFCGVDGLVGVFSPTGG